MILYEGKSEIEKNKDVVVIATGINGKSKNPKTGDMVQTWILLKDESPSDAVKSGADRAVCGDCKHRPFLFKKITKVKKGKKPCYVNTWQAPLAVWKAYKKGKYSKPSDEEISKAVAGRMVRLGAYGDPMAVPRKVWDNLLKKAKGHTGYTHQWDRFSTANGKWQALVMASADTPEEARHATKKGFRYFRVMPKNETMKDEILCPASKEAGEKSQCAKCRLCSGTTSNSWKSIAIVQH
jgi:hypothetical protein